MLLAWLPEDVPGFGAPGEDELSFSIGELLLDIVDPPVVVLAIGAALSAGRWRGVRGAASFLVRGTAGGRGLPWVRAA